MDAACDDCVSILQDAASLLSSGSVEAPLSTLFNAEYQTRLTANVCYSKCHMCCLLYAQIPALREPYSSTEVLAIVIWRARDDYRATTVGLIGFERDAVDCQAHYPGSIRIQHGERSTMTSMLGVAGGSRLIKKPSCTWPCSNHRVKQDLVTRNAEQHSSLAEELYLISQPLHNVESKKQASIEAHRRHGNRKERGSANGGDRAGAIQPPQSR